MARTSSISTLRATRTPRKVARSSSRDDPMPQHVEPMLATLSHLPPDPRHWAFEYKWDGVRALAYHEPGSRRGDARWLIESRNQLDITRRYPELHALRDALRKHDAVLDGEIVALDEDDRPSFARLQRRMHVNGDARIASLAREVPVLYVLFDLLYLNGQSLMDRPYSQRRDELEKLRLSGPSWQITPSHIGRGSEMLDAARRHGMEGVVAKRLESVYEPGRRSNCWLKIKIVQRQEFVIGGWTGEATGLPDRIGTMLIGYYDHQGKLHYAGHVGTGLSGGDHPILIKQFRKLARASSPFVEKLPASRRGGMKIQYLEPRLVAEVEYRRWPDEGLVQQASFKGLREDKEAKEVVREKD